MAQNEIEIVVKSRDEASAGLQRTAGGLKRVEEASDNVATKASTATGAFGALASGVDLMNQKYEKHRQALSNDNNQLDLQISKLQKSKTSSNSKQIDAQVAALQKKKAANDAESTSLDVQEAKTQKYTNALMTAQLAADALSGVTDLLVLATNLSAISKARDAVATVASTVASKAASIATRTWAAVQWLLNAAMTANPIGLVIAAIAILIGIIVLVATRTRFFQTVWAAVWGFMKAVGAWFAGPFVNFFKRAFDMLVAGVKWYFNIYKTVFSAIINFVRTVPGKIVSFFSNLGARFNSVGRNIVQGIINGIKSMVGHLASVAANAAKSALNAAKRFLGIHSPSTVFRDQVGKQMAAGMAQGFTNNVGAITGAVGAGSQASAGAMGGGGGQGGGQLKLVGNTDTIFATMFQKLINDGKITIPQKIVVAR